MTLRVTIPNISFLIFGHWRIDYCVVSIESSLPRTKQLVAHNCQILRVLTKTIGILSLLASMVILRASVCWCLLWGRLFSTKIKEKIFLVKILFYFFIKKICIYFGDDAMQLEQIFSFQGGKLYAPSVTSRESYLLGVTIITQYIIHIHNIIHIVNVDISHSIVNVACKECILTNTWENLLIF